MVLLVSLLIANLVATHIDNFVLTYKKDYNPAIFTWIGMAVVVVIYYPLFSHIDKWSGIVANRFLNAGKIFFGKKLGIFIAFFLAVFVLYYLYGKLWFNYNVLRSLVNIISGIL